MQPSFIQLQWDTQFFNFNVGEISGEVTSSEQMKLIEELIIKNQTKLSYFINCEEIKNSILNESNLEFKLVDKRLTYSKEINKTADSCSQISSLISNEITPEIIKLAISAGGHSRYKTDDYITNQEFENLYEKLLYNPTGKLLVYKLDDQPIGLIILTIKNGEAFINLIAVHEKCRNQGVGSQLIQEAENHFLNSGFEKLHIITQQDNKSACNLYEKSGFKVSSTGYFYHIWNK